MMTFQQNGGQNRGYHPQDMGQQQQQRLLDLANRSGFPMLQTNGQRRYGPPPNWVGPPPAKGSEVFVGKIPRNCYEDELVPLFEKIGPIYELRLMMDFSGFNRGYGFVMYRNPEDAQTACRTLNDYELRRGKKIGVVPSKDNCRLFVGRIPKDKSREDVLEAFSDMTEGVVDAIVHPSHADPKENRGYAFIEYESHRAAAMARRKLLPGKMCIWGSEIQVDWAQPESQVDERIMSQVSNLYVRNIHPNATEEDLMTLFSFRGSIDVARVKRLKEFSFIHYNSRSDAETALHMSQSPNFGNYLAADGGSLHVTWAKPADFKQRSQRRPNHNHMNQSPVNSWQAFNPRTNAGGGDSRHNNSWPPHFQMGGAATQGAEGTFQPSPVISWSQPQFLQLNNHATPGSQQIRCPLTPFFDVGALFSPEINRTQHQWFNPSSQVF